MKTLIIYFIFFSIFIHNFTIASCFAQLKPSLENINTYANTYGNYTEQILKKLLKFDCVIIEPYDVLNINFLKKLKSKNIIIFAYISIGEIDYNRRYLKNWKLSFNTKDNPKIPRSKVQISDDFILNPNIGWDNAYFVDASNLKWHNIILNEELPYILWLGNNLYDGFFLDVVDVVDYYKTLNNFEEKINGMISLIKKIRKQYPNKLLMVNRGFTILDEIANDIDAIMFEEYTSGYGNIKGEKNYKKYYLNFDENNNRINQELIFKLKNALKINPKIKVFILDHINTNPLDLKTAQFCYNEALKLANELNTKILWNANAYYQDLPIFEFLFNK